MQTGSTKGAFLSANPDLDSRNPILVSAFHYSRFHITLPRRVAKFVGKLGTSLRSSQLRGELASPIANFET